MIRDLTRLAATPFDVLVIGGGIHGLAVAYDAAQRGLSVALVERGDFGSGSSFNHARTVHGGLRSLQTGDVGKARFSIRERRAMARIAPHLVTPLPFMMATTSKLTRTRLAMRAGFLLDAAIGFDRNAGVRPWLRLPSGHVVGREAYRRVFGESADGAATGGARWCDYHMPEADRLTLAFAQAAAASGAVIANYVEALEPLRSGTALRGVHVTDALTGQRFDIEARVTVNATGAHCPTWMEAFGERPSYPMLKAMNLVTSRPAGPVAMGAPTSGGRLLLIMPWHGRMLIGTSHSNEPVGPDADAVSWAELVGFVAEANSAFPALGLTPGEVTLVHRGVVPARANRRGELALMGHHQVRDHAAGGIEGAVSVVGVKYTTSRGVAEQVVDLLGRKLRRRLPASRSALTPLPGADMASREAETSRATEEAGRWFSAEAAAAVVATHGTGWRALASLCRDDASLVEPISAGFPLPRAAIVHAIRADMAHTLLDVVVRRTGAGAAGYPGDGAVSACAAIAARELGWDAGCVAAETAAVRAFYAPVGTASTGG